MNAPTNSPEASPAQWRRLSSRVVWVDLAQSVVSLLPGVVAVGLFNVSPSFDALWPLAVIAVFGVVGAVGDIVRWAFTRYRVGTHELERSTGVFVRRQRTIQLDRIRSVDTHAKLRHRLAGLRIVTIGAGQQTGAGESALLLDALTTDQAAALRDELLHSHAARGTSDPAVTTREGEGAEPGERVDRVEVIETFRSWWAVYNVASIWAFIMAAGLIWGAQWFLTMFDFDLFGFVLGAADWRSFGWPAIVALAVLGAGIVGLLGMGVNYFTTYWGFELARVHTDDKSYLRTRRGLFSTHEVSRDESRIRGVSIGEPLFWQWMRAADTNVITTGLDAWSAEQPTAILPRTPLSVAREAAVHALGDPSPFDASLGRHPNAALRRRLWWATLVGLAPAAAVLVPVASDSAPRWLLWATLGVLPVALLAGWIAYRALGHTISGDYLVVRSGLMSRTTSALRRDAVSTIAVRQSVLQKRLGLCTVSAMTAAGWGIYEAPDIAAEDGLGFAAQAAPGLMDDLVGLHAGELSAAR